MNPISQAWASVKAATARLTMRWSRGDAWAGFSWLAGTTYDYRQAAGDGRTNAAVMACIRFVQRTIPEAPLVVVGRNAQGELAPAPEHPLQALLEVPNPHYSGLHLIGALVADLMLTGNAYALKVRSGAGRPVELWWVPSTMIEPKWAADGSQFIGWYDYTVDGVVARIDQHDVVHIRQGFDPCNIRKGLSDLECLFREVATDNEAAQMSATLLRNQAVPGVILSPEGDKVGSPADLESIKASFMSKFGGDRRGEPLVMQGATKVSVLSWSPEQMNLRSLRQIPEERITAVFGIPAAVIGLGAGLDTTKVGATMREMREQAYESCLIPLQRLMTAELQMQLVPDFGDPSRLRVQFDLSEVRVLQDDQNALHERARADLSAGLLTLNQALMMIGEEPVDGEQGDIRYVPNTVTVKTLDTLIPDEQPAALAEPTPLRALPAPAQDEAAAGKGASPSSLKAADLSIGFVRTDGDGSIKSAIWLDDDGNPVDWRPLLATKAMSDDALLARFDAGLALLSEDLADDLMGAFEDLAETVAGRYHQGAKDLIEAEMKKDGDIIDGLVTLADHEPIQRLLRSYVLKSMRQAAEDLSPLTDGPIRIQRNTPAVKAAIAEMETRMPGIAATTGDDFGRLIRRLERRPGSVPLQDVRSALIGYIGEAYPSRAEMIARTELGSAHAAGVIHVAEKSGIASHVHVHDGTGDGPCKERNGATVTLEEARGLGLAHPHCQLRLTPIIEAVA